jgi:hypothetical protein
MVLTKGGVALKPSTSLSLLVLPDLLIEPNRV